MKLCRPVASSSKGCARMVVKARESSNARRPEVKQTAPKSRAAAAGRAKVRGPGEGPW